MTRHLGFWLALFPLVYPADARPVDVQDRPQLTLGVCDKASVNPEVLASAKRQTLAIFGRAGVNVRWVDLDHRSKCAIPAGTFNWFVILIVPKATEGPSPNAMGFAPSRRVPFPRAYVFYNWVQTFVRIVGQKQKAQYGDGVILGHAIAHELGHLLIPDHSHSLMGIMSSEWEYKHWEDAASGRLLFNQEEAGAIRAELSKCCGNFVWQ
jgi:hypothetical protein